MTLATLLGAIAVFASTDIDDILLLSVFFSDPKLRARAIVMGQFLGIGVLTLVSAGAALAALAVPEGWTALLGIAPLALGVWKLIGLRRNADADEQEVHEREGAAEQRSGSQVLAVTAVTLANGGDNVGVYIPLFAKEPAALPVYVIVFAVMTALWCWLGYALVNNRIIGEHLKKYGRIALPFVLIGLGIHILWGARALLP